MANNKRAAAKVQAAQNSEAQPPQILLEHTTLQGQQLRVVIKHAPGIDFFVDVELFKDESWVPVKRGLKELFSPVNAAMEVTILQLTRRLEEAQAQLQTLQKPA